MGRAMHRDAPWPAASGCRPASRSDRATRLLQVKVEREANRQQHCRRQGRLANFAAPLAIRAAQAIRIPDSAAQPIFQ